VAAHLRSSRLRGLWTPVRVVPRKAPRWQGARRETRPDLVGRSDASGAPRGQAAASRRRDLRFRVLEAADSSGSALPLS